MLIRIMPQIIKVPSTEKWKKMNDELCQFNESLEKKVEARTAALAENGATFKFMTDTIPQLVWTAPQDGKLDYFNRHWFQYSGLSYEKSCNTGWQRIIHPEDRQQVIDAWEKVVNSGQKFERECRLHGNKEGEYRWHLLRALAMKNQDGSVNKWFGTATDIHDQKIKTVELRKVNEELDNFVYTASHDLKAH